MKQATLTVAEYREAWTEDELGQYLMGEARLHGWRVVHFRAARTAKGWRTAFEGDDGFPDWVLARDGVVIFAELKRAPKYKPSETTPGQLAWKGEIGARYCLCERVCYHLWTPLDLTGIAEHLT